MNACAVHTSLLGRYAVGHWAERNPKFVWPTERKRKRVYGPECDEYYVYHRITAPVVAVTIDHYLGDQYLKFWVLRDDKPQDLCRGAKVMPSGWTPPPERL